MNRHPLATSALVLLVRLVSGVRARWRAPADVTPRLYFANHSSHLDAVVIWAALPPAMRVRVRPVAALDYWGRTALRRFVACKVLNAVLIDRERNPHAAIEAMAQALETHSLIFFPEGTRGDGVAVGPFRGGLFHLAQRRPEVELVPVYLQNLSRILPKGEFLPVPLLGSVSFGAPLRLEAQEEKGRFLERARGALSQLNMENGKC